jgi:hypothetical protein
MINLGSILVGIATLVVANVLTCNNHSQNSNLLTTCVHGVTGTYGTLWCRQVHAHGEELRVALGTTCSQQQMGRNYCHCL